MSEENVEIVRRFMDAMQRFFDAYWDKPCASSTRLGQPALAGGGG
jgi:hypothetical protein